MRKLSSVLLAAAVLGAARGVESGDSNAEGSAAPANCLADFNAARERAGLEAFTEEEEEGKKVPTAKEEIAKICSAIQEASGLHSLYRRRTGAAFNITGATVERDGTYADCALSGNVKSKLGSGPTYFNVFVIKELRRPFPDAPLASAGVAGRHPLAPADCLADFNAARERAGLEAFIAETDATKKLPTGEEEHIAAICSVIGEASGPHFSQTVPLCLAAYMRLCSAHNGKASDITGAGVKREGTYAYAPETGPADGCSAAVSYWKKAYVNFGELPPEYNGDTDVYAESRNRSLVALYNPNKGATVDCAYITCPVSTTTTTTVATSAGSTDKVEEDGEDEKEEIVKGVSGERETGGPASSGEQPKICGIN
ncbi:SAG family member [Eimeria mitis]|uniref:SAG family member n=1 Tax=Eimeria mitis TaxID=44415 RepID=U6K2I7_9EIME|nr:SAG family member [Eimeria mitis]CDJ31930.1 SAG family member [Eimeria mitis]